MIDMERGSEAMGMMEPNGIATREEDRYVTTREAATLLGVNRATVINWARQGRFAAIQYGTRGIYRFERREILEFLERSRLDLSLRSAQMADDED